MSFAVSSSPSLVRVAMLSILFFNRSASGTSPLARLLGRAVRPLAASAPAVLVHVGLRLRSLGCEAGKSVRSVRSQVRSAAAAGVRWVLFWQRPNKSLQATASGRA